MDSITWPEPGAELALAPASPEVLRNLARRRSSLAQRLGPPGPGPEQLEQLLRLAIRVPDHGNLAPWRFILLDGADKALFAEALEDLARTQENPAKAVAALVKLRHPPTTVVVVSRLQEGKIPAWEQQMSAGALCMNLLTAAQAMGIGGSWITGWYAYDARANDLLGLQAEERIAGYVHLGTPQEPPRERSRPDISALVSRWSPSRDNP